MQKQSEEEMVHAMKFYNHLVERGGRVEFEALEKPKFEWSSSLDAFQDAYKHEQFITRRINHMYEEAKAEKDNPAQILLHWFIEEQVEEEDNTSKIVQILERLGDFGPGLFMVDKKLGKRE